MDVKTRNPIVGRTVRSPFPDVKIPNIAVHLLILQKLAERKNETALIDAATGREYSASELRSSSLRVANGLRRLGFRQGEILSIHSGNSVQFIIMALGTLAAGGIINTLNPSFKEGEIEYQLRDVGAKWIYTTLDLFPVLRNCRQMFNLKGIIVDRKDPNFVSFQMLDAEPEMSENLVVSDLNPREDPAAILYSSGTTGLPKGVVLTHLNLISYSYIMGFLRDEAGQMRELLFLPLYHAYGLTAVCLNAFIRSVLLIVMPRFLPELFLDSIQKYKITSVPLAPPTIVFLLKSPLVNQYDMTSLSTVWSGAAPLGGDTEQLFVDKFPHAQVRQGWGMTETTAAGLIVPRKFPPKPGSSGILCANTEMKVIDPPSGKPLASRNVGEIVCRGPHVMKGYLNNEAATKKDLDAEGWLRTGDLGYYDEDGYFFIVDRIKELIKYKAFQVAPAELEAVLLTHPAVADVGVVGIPEAETGEIPKAYVVVKEGYHTTEAELLQYVADKVAYYKQLRGGVMFVSEIPKSPSGKILRRELRKLTTRSKL